MGKVGPHGGFCVLRLVCKVGPHGGFCVLRLVGKVGIIHLHICTSAHLHIFNVRARTRVHIL